MATITEFQRLVDKAERQSRVSPGLYRLRVGALAALGYGYVIVLTLASLALGVGLTVALVYSKAVVLIKFALIPIFFAFMLMRALWVRLEPPKGLLATAKTTPALFAELADVRGRLRAARVHRVLIARDDFNAAIVQVPRLGLFGWPRNYLLLGLPLMEALTKEELRAVLAHELGHLSRNQTRFRNWIYRSRQTWARLGAAVARRGGMGSGLVTGFLGWFAPYFNASTFVLARANEYDADRAAALVAGADVAGRALVAVAAKAPYVEGQFWEDLLRRAEHEAEPPTDVFARYLEAARAVPPDAAQRGLQTALARRTTLDDTHPCLADRLAALGMREAFAPGPVATSAAQALLGPLRDTLVAEGNQSWRERMAPRWQAERRQRQESRQRLAALQADGPPDAQKLFEYANTIEPLEGAAAALVAVDRALGVDARHASSLFMRGRLALALPDLGPDANAHARAIADIEQAMTLAPGAIEPGCKLLADHFYARNDIARCQPHVDRLNRIAAARTELNQRRMTVVASDRFEPNGLPPDMLARIVAACAAEKGVKKVWLVRKQEVYRGTEPIANDPVLVMMVQFGWGRRVDQAALQRLMGLLPQDLARVVLNKAKNRTTAVTLTAVAGAQVYPA